MAKEGDLWDDSALINAFDNAMVKYKKIHTKGFRDSLTAGEGAISSGMEGICPPIDEIHEATRQLETENNNNVLPNIVADMEGASNVSILKENNPLDSSSHGLHVDSSPCSNTQEAFDGHAQLINKYYELEEQRQQVLQQLHEMGYWSNQCSGELSGYYARSGICSTVEYPVPTNQDTQLTGPISCCPYACHCMVVPCPSMPDCAVGGAYDNTTVCNARKMSSLEDDGVVKTAMKAAESALSSMKMKTSGTSNVYEEKKKGKESKEDSGLSECEVAQSRHTETDLTALLNAWYTAGFYTGKYLLEQSIAKRRHE